jgi:syntaxin-binding protein 1
MIHDLLVLDNGKYSLKMEENSEKKAGAAALDEDDPIWRLIRHWHFAEAIEYISDTFKKFLGSNKAAEAALGSTEGPTGIEALNQMKDTLSALPEFQEMKAKFSLHINICQECQTVFEKRSIGPIAGIEQDLATGETSDGRVAKGIMQKLVPILFNEEVPIPYVDRTTELIYRNLDKLRLVMLYIICQDGIIDQDRKKLLQYSKLDAEDCQAINNLGIYRFLIFSWSWVSTDALRRCHRKKGRAGFTRSLRPQRKTPRQEKKR